MPDVRSVLVVCTGNTCRSPLAAGLLRLRLQDHPEIEVVSAGTSAWPGSPATPEAIAVGQEWGLDLTRHSAQVVSEERMTRAQLVIALTPAHAQWLATRFPQDRAKVHTLGELALNAWEAEVEDPVGRSLDTYRRIARQLQTWVEAARPAILNGLEHPSPHAGDRDLRREPQ